MMNMLPGDSISKVFTVTNIGNLNAVYNIEWKDLYNEIMYDELELSLSCGIYNRTTNVYINSCESVLIPVGTTNNDSIKNNITIDVDTYHKYNLKLTFKEIGSNQDYNQGKNMHGSIIITSGSTSRATLTGILMDQNSSILANKKVIAHSDPVSTITNERGEFSLEGIEFGTHEILVQELNGTSIASDTVTIEESKITDVQNKNILWNDTKRYIYKILVELGTSDVSRLSVIYGNETREDCFEFSLGSINDYKCVAGNRYGLPTITDVVIPNTIGGISVTKIGSRSFNYNQLTSVEMPTTINSIGYGAFGSNNLTSVEIPNSVTSIENYAFEHNQITEFILSDKISTIPTHCFEYNILTSLSLPSSVTKIETNAFANNKLKELALPTSVTIIEDGAFSRNPYDNISGLYVFGVKDSNNDGIAETDYSRIIGCKESSIPSNIELPDTTSNASLKQLDSNLFSNVNINTYSLYLPSTINYIGDNNFSNSNIYELTLPENIGYIGVSAFEDNNITAIDIPSGVTIGSSAFSNNKLTTVNLTEGISEINYSVFADNQLTSIKIPSSVTYIGDYAFANNQLTSISIPKKCWYIGVEAFANNLIRNVTFQTREENCHDGFCENSLLIENSVFGYNPVKYAIIDKQPSSYCLESAFSPLGDDNKDGFSVINIYGKDEDDLNFETYCDGSISSIEEITDASPEIISINNDGASSLTDCFTFNSYYDEYIVTSFNNSCGSKVIVPEYYNGKKVNILNYLTNNPNILIPDTVSSVN